MWKIDFKVETNHFQNKTNHFFAKIMAQIKFERTVGEIEVRGKFRVES